jgi:L-asparaginase
LNGNASILIIYTGGTIGMMQDAETGALYPLDFKELHNKLPDLKRFGFKISSISFNPPVDSANVDTAFWIRLADIIGSNYGHYDGFVVLHGTDTMAYSASALSFMLGNLQKPVIFTGSQLPLGTIRTDGKENLVTSIEIAAEKRNGVAVVPEVCIYFENKLFRGNRTTKYSAEHFNAFRSVNYPSLAETGIHIKYNYPAIQYPSVVRELKIFRAMDNNIALIKLFPGLSENYLNNVLQTKNLKALVLETYGSGNAMTAPWFLANLKKAIDKGLLILNVSQCFGGGVEMGMYKTSIALRECGVISGFDTTTEAALTKLMFLLGQNLTKEEIIEALNMSLRGEISVGG